MYVHMYHSNFLQQYILYNHLQASSYAGPTFLPATNKKTSPVWNVAGTVPNVCGILNYNECKAQQRGVQNDRGNNGTNHACDEHTTGQCPVFVKKAAALFFEPNEKRHA